ncbi:19S proteasome regulatory subunit Rpn125 / FY16936)) [Taphrina deformans PYCC 5710]|uniref:19S proteasome regulatory subunit Rpn125 / FY16936 n=1 Tax=Taphrina deformans (strain PYCC 5710 / ATCC 11124 / CBS 356.35 / IMI 108563 / JCM 9778 / NBRC 8474) TaxID=1097556 RepID=R4X7M1_TAPDE|nr:19S proteasome regulatory subunit Rpn125 / FY16936)) [Taphrina deformans PYCC 5710]|eukprot:CCG81426.1 19S proteasome regulatory subunit Rpn125 / FY16936)) [Taphrina deformans PYCC 5710]
MVDALLKAYEKGDITALKKLLEKSALASSKDGDIEGYKKNYQQLKPLYSPSDKPTSNQNTIIALHLLILLSESNISQFHSELESLPESSLESAEVQWVRSVEQGIMEGSYQEVRKLLDSPPSKHFATWGSLMTESIRADIADCSASSYTSLPLVNLTTLLLLKNVKETEQFAGERGWLVQNGRVIFPKKDAQVTSATGGEMEIDGEETDGTAETARNLLITQTLGYARELESIV